MQDSCSILPNCTGSDTDRQVTPSSQASSDPEQLLLWKNRLAEQDISLKERLNDLSIRANQIRNRELELQRKEAELKEQEAQIEKLRLISENRKQYPDKGACLQAQDNAAALESCSSQLQDMIHTVNDFQNCYRSLIQTIGQDCRELNLKLDCSHLWDGLTELCLMARSMQQVNDPRCADFGRSLTVLLQERFGCICFTPASGEAFDPLRMDQEILSSPTEYRTVHNCICCGWTHGSHVLCKAIVSLNQEVY